jgi:AraC-like DNA-binding protein
MSEIGEYLRCLVLDKPEQPVLLKDVARRLGCTPRTLQRHLHQRGTTFRKLVDAVRLDLASSVLQEHASVSHAASAAGFAEASSFHRAFKRWTGGTPRSVLPKAGTRRAPGLERLRLAKQGLSQAGLAKPGLPRPGLSRPGLSRPGLSRPGLSRPGLSRRSIEK